MYAWLVAPFCIPAERGAIYHEVRKYGMIRAMKKEQAKKITFVKLTRLDGSPIWLNASYVVTVEPRKGGGTTVVPIGDGLDYDVRENPETVLAVLDGAPVPDVVPVPTSDALTLTPDDVSPESSSDAGFGAEAKPDAKSTKKTPRKSPSRKAEAAEKAEKSEEPKFEPQPTNNSEVELLDEEIARLRKMAPRTVRKLQNTIMTQFKNLNAEATVAALVSRGYLSIDGTHINWLVPGELNFAAEIAAGAGK